MVIRPIKNSIIVSLIIDQAWGPAELLHDIIHHHHYIDIDHEVIAWIAPSYSVSSIIRILDTTSAVSRKAVYSYPSIRQPFWVSHIFGMLAMMRAIRALIHILYHRVSALLSLTRPFLCNLYFNICSDLLPSCHTSFVCLLWKTSTVVSWHRLRSISQNPMLYWPVLLK